MEGACESLTSGGSGCDVHSGVEDTDLVEKAPSNADSLEKCASCGLGEPPESFDEEHGWIQCDVCKRWFHEICVKSEEYERDLVEHFHCPECRPEAGPSVMKSVMLRHRHNFDAAAERDLPTQVGTPRFIEEFIKSEASIPEPPPNVLEVFDEGEALMRRFKFTEEWKNPYKVLKPEGLGLKIPHKAFDINDVVELIGEDFNVKTIDVYAQQSVMMSLGRFKAAWDSKPRDRLYNILSLEFSDTPLSTRVESPLLVRKLSWVEKYWNRNKNSKEADVDDAAIYDNSSYRDSYIPSYSELYPEHSNSKPPVDYFCLLGMAGSWTDFHIDFGGSSVWYHVHTGEKVFYVAKPSKGNLKLFAEHLVSADRYETFFGDRLPAGELFRVEVKENETLFIPSGWIHSVYTPVDTLVFGGNFLHSRNIPTQLRVYQIELDAKTPESFCFPSFELTNWYAARDLVEILKDANALGEPADQYRLDGAKAMIPLLDRWMEERESMEVPVTFVMFGSTRDALKVQYRKQEKLLKRLEAEAETADDESAYLDVFGASPKHSPLKLKISLASSARKTTTRRRGGKAEMREDSDDEEDDEKLDVKTFARRSSRGREVRPSQKMSQCLQGGEEAAANENGSAPAARTSQQFSEEERKEMELVEKLAEREEREARRQQAKKTKARPTTSTSNSQNPTPRLTVPKKKPPSTVKGRLAKKLKLK